MTCSEICVVTETLEQRNPTLKPQNNAKTVPSLLRTNLLKQKYW